MSLYGNFTLKEWLALHCTTKDVNDLFRKALKDNDEPMAVLALAELITRGDNDLVTRAIQEATDAGCFVLGSHFSDVFANALTKLGDRDQVLRRIAKNVRRNGYWPKTSKELTLDYLSDAEQIKTLAQDMKGRRKHSGAQKVVRHYDDRLDKFLESFAQEGWFSIEIGFYSPGAEWDLDLQEHVIINIGEHYNLVIKDGFILNREEIPNVLNILDAAGIQDALPAFNGNELDLYTLDDDGNWVSSERAKEENFFYTTFYSVK